MRGKNKPAPMGQAECLSQAFDSWKRDIADTYAALRRLVTPAELESLEGGQHSWEAYRDQEFDFLNAMLLHKRGSLYIPIRICKYRIEILKARALELERYMERLKRSDETELAIETR